MQPDHGNLICDYNCCRTPIRNQLRVKNHSPSIASTIRNEQALQDFPRLFRCGRRPFTPSPSKQSCNNDEVIMTTPVIRLDGSGAPVTSLYASSFSSACPSYLPEYMWEPPMRPQPICSAYRLGHHLVSPGTSSPSQRLRTSNSNGDLNNRPTDPPGCRNENLPEQIPAKPYYRRCWFISCFFAVVMVAIIGLSVGFTITHRTPKVDHRGRYEVLAEYHRKHPREILGNNWSITFEK